MITRIVKMTFRQEETGNFLEVFNANKKFIAASEGCRSLRLLNDKDNTGVFFTISEWDSEEYLNQYRDSELFARVWGKTKMMFAAKPEAWTVLSTMF